jgi:hypothetical protein
MGHAFHHHGRHPHFGPHHHPHFGPHHHWHFGVGPGFVAGAMLGAAVAGRGFEPSSDKLSRVQVSVEPVYVPPPGYAPVYPVYPPASAPYGACPPWHAAPPAGYGPPPGYVPAPGYPPAQGYTPPGYGPQGCLPAPAYAPPPTWSPPPGYAPPSPTGPPPGYAALQSPPYPLPDQTCYRPH